MVVFRVAGERAEAILIDGRLSRKLDLYKACSRDRMTERVRQTYGLSDRRLRQRLARGKLFGLVVSALADDYFEAMYQDPSRYNLFLVDPYKSDPDQQEPPYTVRGVFTHALESFWATPSNYRRLLATYPLDLSTHGRECSRYLIETSRFFLSTDSHLGRTYGRSLPRVKAITEAGLKELADLEATGDTHANLLDSRRISYERLWPRSPERGLSDD